MKVGWLFCEICEILLSVQAEQEDKKQIKEQYEKMIQETKQEVILVMFVFLNYFNYYMCILGYIDIDTTGIFLENNFKYQNAHDKEFGGAISANYGGFFTISS